DTHYANLFSTDPGLSLSNDSSAVTYNSSNANNLSSLPSDAGESTNLYQGFFDFQSQVESNWNNQGGSNQGATTTISQSPFPKDRLANTTSQRQAIESP